VSANIQLLAVDGNALSGNLESEDPSILVVTQSGVERERLRVSGRIGGKTSISVTANGNQVRSSRHRIRRAHERGRPPRSRRGRPSGPTQTSSPRDAGGDANPDGSAPVREAGSTSDARTRVAGRRPPRRRPQRGNAGLPNAYRIRAH